MSRAERIAQEHFEQETRTLEGGFVHYERSCNCGHPLPWRNWESVLIAHVAHITAEEIAREIEAEMARRDAIAVSHQSSTARTVALVRREGLADAASIARDGTR